MARVYGRTYQPRAQYLAERGLQQALAGTYKIVDTAVRVAAVKGFAEGQRRAGDKASEVQKFLGEALGGGAFGQQLIEAHREIGLAAQRSVVAAYTHRRNRRDLPAYRMGGGRDGRYANGALLRALQSPDFFEADRHGIKFINEDRLDKEAAQWRRLNFGAGGRAGAGPKRFSGSYGGLVVEAIGLDPDPRPAFRLPSGFWVGPGGERQPAGEPGTGMFYPVGQAPPGIRGRPRPPRMSAGIEATNFLDAGIDRIVRLLGPSYDALYARAIENNTMGSIARRVSVPVVVPFSSGVRVRTLR